MVQLYDEMIILHEVVALLVCIQKKVQEVLKLLKVVNIIIDQIREWASKYPDVPLQLVRKDRIASKVDRLQLRLHHQNFIRLGEQSSNTLASYSRLHNGLESLEHNHVMPSQGSLGEIRGKEIILQEVRQYIKQIKQTSEQEGLEITKDIILRYVIAPTKAHMKCLWLWNSV